MTTIYKCDRCNVELDQYYTYEIENKYYTLCHNCTDLIKRVLKEYWDKSTPYERLGRIPSREEVGKHIPMTHFNAYGEKTPEVESHHALARLFYWLFYKKVEVEK